VVTVHYDPLLMKIIAAAATRSAAVARLEAALEACRVDGVPTTIPFLRRLLAHEAFARGAVDTQMVERGAFHA
jgi:acetyl/propionyl-CoA carboxylase alpha subunit